MNQNLIYDVGMHNGDDTAYYLHCGFNVIAIEANPSLCVSAKTRFQKEIELGRLHILNIGIDSSTGVRPFWICETHSAWSSFHRSVASRDGCLHYSVEVPCQPFSWVLENYGVPYYLKIDIEGNDELCIEGLKSDVPRFISFEGGANKQRVLNILDNLHQLGYSRYKCISQLHFLPVQKPPSREGLHYERWKWLLNNKGRMQKYIRRIVGQKHLINFVFTTQKDDKWIFSLGSSGPFGEKTPGEWYGYNEMKALYNYYLDLFARRVSSPFWSDKDYSFWIDFHAKID